MSERESKEKVVPDKQGIGRSGHINPLYLKMLIHVNTNSIEIGSRL